MGDGVFGKALVTGGVELEALLEDKGGAIRDRGGGE